MFMIDAKINIFVKYAVYNNIGKFSGNFKQWTFLAHFFEKWTLKVRKNRTTHAKIGQLNTTFV